MKGKNMAAFIPKIPSYVIPPVSAHGRGDSHKKS